MFWWAILSREKAQYNVGAIIKKKLKKSPKGQILKKDKFWKNWISKNFTMNTFCSDVYISNNW